MSYILEALRKADADRERERGGIPTIHSPGPSTPAQADDDLDGDDDIRRRPAPRLLVGAVVGLGLTVISLIGWLWLGPSDRGAPPVAEAAPPRLDHAPPPPAAPNPPPVLQAVPPMPSPGWDAAVPRAAPAPSQQPVARVAPKEARSDAAPAPAPAAASAVVRVPTLDELPDDVRRQLPVLAVNGSKYADAPASRILILNGQIFHEGDRITPDLTLEHIRLKEAELRYRGQRYLIKF